MELDQKRIEDAIVAEVAHKMLGDDELYDRTKRAIDARIDKLWKETAENRIRSEVELAIAAGFEREYQKVDGFGNKVGEKTSIRAELERLIYGYWNERVGRDGKKTDSNYNTTSRAEWMMTKLCADDFAGQMKSHITNVTGALKDGFRKELHSTVNRLLSEAFHVRSLDDQGKGREVIDPVAKPVGAA
jgi:hypothetical protein